MLVLMYKLHLHLLTCRGINNGPTACLAPRLPAWLQLGSRLLLLRAAVFVLYHVCR
jgi:hypothetical protein